MRKSELDELVVEIVYETAPYYGAYGGQAVRDRQTCDEDDWLEYQWMMTDGLYTNTEIGEGPASWV